MYGLVGSQGLSGDVQDRSASTLPATLPLLSHPPVPGRNPAWLCSQSRGKSALHPIHPQMLLLPIAPRKAPAPSFKLHRHLCKWRYALQWAFTGGPWGLLGLDTGTPPVSVHPDQNPLPLAPGLPPSPAVSPLDHPFQRDLAEGLYSNYHLWSKCVLPGKYLPSGVTHMSEM